jgi:hypothetical protein
MKSRVNGFSRVTASLLVAIVTECAYTDGDSVGLERE